MSVVEQLQFVSLHAARSSSTHLQPHDLPMGLCVTAWATTPCGVSVVEQLQLLALHSAIIIALHAHPQSLLQGEMVLDTPSSEHEQLIASQFTVKLAIMSAADSSWMI